MSFPILVVWVFFWRGGVDSEVFSFFPLFYCFFVCLFLLISFSFNSEFLHSYLSMFVSIKYLHGKKVDSFLLVSEKVFHVITSTHQWESLRIWDKRVSLMKWNRRLKSFKKTKVEKQCENGFNVKSFGPNGFAIMIIFKSFKNSIPLIKSLKILFHFMHL